MTSCPHDDKGHVWLPLQLSPVQLLWLLIYLSRGIQSIVLRAIQVNARIIGEHLSIILNLYLHSNSTADQVTYASDIVLLIWNCQTIVLARKEQSLKNMQTD